MQEIEECLNFLTTLKENPDAWAKLSDADRTSLMRICGEISYPDRATIRQRRRQERKQERLVVASRDRQLRSQTGIRAARQPAIFLPPPLLQASGLGEEVSARNCYVCKAEFTTLHHFYDSMCPECAEFNYQKRFERADLTGMTALITGARLKIGYQSALIMLESGARVIVTTRFPADAAIRFSKEARFGEWQNRLHIHGLDLRHTPSVERFCDFFIERYGALDLLINNAAQTVRRPFEFYAHMMPIELGSHENLPGGAQKLLGDFRAIKDDLSLPQAWSGNSLFPQGKLDSDLQQVDLRTTNSWRLKLGQIDTAEMLELQLINSVAPFVLCNKLLPLMQKTPTGKKHIVNVSAMEGKFYRFKKEARHPHTNMAKAALNMLTHTSAGDLAKEGIFMNAVDTGWVTDEDPAHLAELKQRVHDFQPPLDIVDGAARVCDPFVSGINSGEHMHGKFLKDYKPIDW